MTSTKYAAKDRARITKKRHFNEVAFFIGNYKYEFGVNLFRKTITPSSLIEFS
ncbi:hypothetical protein [Alteromonas abrolhosensis]|uniref:hypothetical protein n=1 Tax=Alteromonas abrolhosensis TaxID=1892904 RepID=UPI0012FF9EA0|nr:hypothetical protein [Alteromonas abrolhosensis]